MQGSSAIPLIVGVILVAVVGYQSWQIERQIELNRDLQKQVADLAVRPPETRQADIETQQKCADSAAKFFKEGGWDQAQSNITNGYMSHFNTSLGRCFIRIDSADYSKIGSDKQVMHSSLLNDAIEGVPYGSFILVRNSERISEVKVVACFQTPPGTKTRKCGTEAEWEHFAGQLMN